VATSRYVLCSICEAQHTIKNADNWCPECDEGLCSECLKHHNVSKYTKTHEVISIEKYHCSFIFLRSSCISLWIFRRWSVIFVRFLSLYRITLSMLLDMSFNVSSILSSIADVFAVLAMFSIANNPTHSK
jgi:hypothetical protein